MKTSPFKIQGGVSPLKQDPKLMVTASNGVSVPKANLKDYENSLKEANKDIAKENIKNKSTEPIVNENLLNVLPGAGEIVDAKNAIKDLVNKDYGGAALNTAGFFLPFLPGGVVKAVGKDIMNYLKKMPGIDDLLKSGKKMTKQQEVDFKKGFAESNGNPITGGVGGNTLDPRIKTGVNPKTNYKYDQEFMDLENPVPSFNRQQLMEVEIPKMKTLGKSLDDSNFDVSSLTKDNITFKGRSGGRTIVEVDLGNGQKQLFYKSTGSAGKAGSGVGGTTEGLWQPYGGHQKNAGGGVSPGWFGKDSGYEDWYKSKSYRDISGNLDKLSIEKGINLDMQMNLSIDLSDEAKKKAYKDLTNADLNEAFQNYSKRVGADQTDNAQIIVDQ